MPEFSDHDHQRWISDLNKNTNNKQAYYIPIFSLAFFIPISMKIAKVCTISLLLLISILIGNSSHILKLTKIHNAKNTILDG